MASQIEFKGVVINPNTGYGYNVEYDAGKVSLVYIGKVDHEIAAVTAKAKMQAKQLEQVKADTQVVGGQGVGGGNTAPTPTDNQQELPAIVSGFKHRLTSVLTDNKYDRRIPKRKRGKLHMAGLWRVDTGAANVFSQKQARKGKNYSVVLLVDNSGSMGGGRMVMANKVANFLGVHFEALEIDFSVISFDHKAEVVKRFSDKLKPINIEARGQTYMLRGLMASLEQLKTVSGQQLVIVISDGATAQAVECTHLVKANPSIKFFGVGIGGEQCEVIPQHKAVDDVTQLQPVILEWLKQNIKRGV